MNTGISAMTGKSKKDRTKMPDYTFSIIITCYNKSRTIARAVDSAMAQGENVEVIVVDDASSDDSQSILRALPEDTRLRFIFGQKNAGALASYVSGFRAAKGQYLVLLDGDDVLLPNLLNAISQSSQLHRDVCLRIGMSPMDPQEDYRDSTVDTITKALSFSPGYWFAATQNTGGTAYIFPKACFDAADGNWDSLLVQDHILPGIISLYCKRFTKLKTVGYRFELGTSPNKLGNQAHQTNCDRILSDLLIFQRAKDLKISPFAQVLLKLALIKRARKYIKIYNLTGLTSGWSLLLANGGAIEQVCRQVAHQIIAQKPTS